MMLQNHFTQPCHGRGCGFPIHSDSFALIDLRLFCLLYVPLICSETPSFAAYCSASVQQKLDFFTVKHASLRV